MSNEFTNDDFMAMKQAMEREQKKSQFQTLYWQPPAEGTHQIRLITPLKQFNEEIFYEKHRIHYISGKPVMCLNQTLKDKNGNVHEAEECPICAKVRKLYKLSEENSEERKVASSISAKDRFVSRIIVRGKKNSEGQDDEVKPEFWEFGKKLHGYFFDQINLGQAGNFLSLKDGRDFNLVKKGTGRNTDYSSSCLSMQTSSIFPKSPAEPLSLDAEKTKKLLDYLSNMEYSQLVEFKSYDEVTKILDEFFMEETAPAVKPSAPVFEPDPLNPFEQSTTSSSSDSEDDIDAILGKI
jgi:hypothetical protein